MSRIASRSAAVALASTALMGLSALAVPGIAGAQGVDCDPSAATYAVTGGSIEWGFKESFRDYFFGNFAHGVLTTSEGVTFKGEQTAPDGRIVWPVTTGTVGSATAATATGKGSANFNAHGGVMNTTLSNPSVEINGTEGVLKLDYSGPAREGGTVSETQADAANFTLPTALNFHNAGTVTTTATATLDEEFVPAFGTYTAGSAVDAVTVTLDITQSCEAGPGDDENPGDDETPGDDENPGDSGNAGIFGSLGTLFGSLGA